ncbi:thiol reductant ABC exporter subunit CydD [Thermodesulfobacteriota bacterium]
MSNDTTHNVSDSSAPPKPLKWLIGNVRHARGWILLSVSAGFAGGLLLILQAALLSKIIHGAFIDGLSQTVLNPLFLTLCGLVALRAGLAWAREVSGFYAGAGVRREIRMALMHHIGALGPVQADRPHSGALSTTIVEQVEALQAFYAHYLPQLALAVSIPAAITAFVFPISWAAGGLLLLTAPLIPLFMILIGMGAENISQKHFQALSRMSAHFLDILQGLPTLKLLGRSRTEETSIAKVSDEHRLRTMKVLRVAFLSTAVLELFSSLSIALVAVYLGTTYLGYSHFGLYGQTLILKQGLFILLLAPDFYLPLRELGIHYHARAEAMGATQEILDILSRQPATTFTGVRQLEASTPLTVECHKIHFAYNTRKGQVLTDVSMKLAPGEHMALVGESGSGKTTLLNLLLGFIQPDQGEIRINGNLLSALALETWHQALAWVGQHPMLFHDTIAGNIGMALPGATRTDIEQAARSARVLDFTRHLPRGLDTKVGEQGWGLSRGQAQRVALARVFLKDAPILLLDEPTAGLDVDTAQSVMQTIASFSKDRTVLLITHRLDQLQTAHRIIAITGGKLVDQGSYTELMKQEAISSKP